MSARRYMRWIWVITFTAMALAAVVGSWPTAHRSTSLTLFVGSDVIALLTCVFFWAALAMPRRFLLRRISRRETELAALRSAFDAAGAAAAAAETQAGSAERTHGPDSTVATAAALQWRQAAFDLHFAAIVHDEAVTTILAEKRWLKDLHAASAPVWLTWWHRRGEIRRLERSLRKTR